MFSDSKLYIFGLRKGEKTHQTEIEVEILFNSNLTYDPFIKIVKAETEAQAKKRNGMANFVTKRGYRRREERTLSLETSNIGEKSCFQDGKQELFFSSEEEASQLPQKFCSSGEKRSVDQPTQGDCLLILAPQYLGQRVLEIKRPLMGQKLRLNSDKRPKNEPDSYSGL